MVTRFSRNTIRGGFEMTVREELEQAVERAIDALNDFDGEAEVEAEPIEQDADMEEWAQPVMLAW